LTGVHAVRQSDVPTLFTNELTLNYQNSLVGHIWQRCSDALGANASRTGRIAATTGQSTAVARLSTIDAIPMIEGTRGGRSLARLCGCHYKTVRVNG
jgi:hypothetical protein